MDDTKLKNRTVPFLFFDCKVKDKDLPPIFPPEAYFYP
jgi:hypothetical protein